MRLAIVLVAAGASTRMGFPKLWADLDGRPLLAHAIAASLAAAPDELVIVVSADRLAEARALVPPAARPQVSVAAGPQMPVVTAPRVTVVAGGQRRRDSVAAGVAACSAPWLAIHDAARALAPPELFERGLAAAQPTGAAVPGMPLKDTIKRVANGRVVATPPRAEHVAVQTPQIFRRDLLLQALAATDADVTDEAALLEHLGIPVAIFEGHDRAFKVTTPQDFALARTILGQHGRTP